MPKQQSQLKNLKLLADNVLVEPISPNIETQSGLIAPTQYEDKAFMGRVIKIGEDIKKKNLIGSIVYFNKYSTTSFIFDGKEYLILKVEDLIAYI